MITNCRWTIKKFNLVALTEKYFMLDDVKLITQNNCDDLMKQFYDDRRRCSILDAKVD